jgi:crotonobetainyl-CoA:carnitine CoA-transferase CaiB-like acyl-CoA transferase
MGYPLYYTMYGGSPPTRAGVRHATVVPYGAYRCGDGDQILFAVQTDAQWRSFCQDVCGHPEWVEDPRFNSVSNRRVNRDALESAIETAFSDLTRAEVTTRLESADIPYGDLNTVDQFSQHPQLAARDRWQAIATPGGPMQALRPPFFFGATELPMGDVPAVGQHTDAVLAELGYDAEVIDRVRAAGAI